MKYAGLQKPNPERVENLVNLLGHATPPTASDTEIVRAINAIIRNPDNSENTNAYFWKMVESFIYHYENRHYIKKVYNDAKKFLEIVTELAKHCSVDLTEVSENGQQT